jgi:thiol-disulfide isomerase/thioredoxin
MIAILAFTVLLLGCTSQSPDNFSDNDTAKLAPGQIDPVNTSNLSFEREVDPDITDLNVTAPEIPEFDFSNITTPDGKLIVYFFYMETCSACKATMPKIDELETEYQDVVFLRYDLTTTNGSYAYKDFAGQYGLDKSQMYVPQVLVNGTIITDMFNINDSLEEIVAAYTGTS